MKMYYDILYYYYNFQEAFYCEDRYRWELSEELQNKIKIQVLRHVDSFELICLLTEYIICGDLDSMHDNSEDLE